MERAKERIEIIRGRVAATLGRGEAATKQALVLPMLELLGYEIWDPLEVCPEFEGDFATRKAGQKEKVDLAIIVGDAPRIFIEVKAADADLDGHEGQLARHFNAVPAVALGVLTNGMEYRFFTDTGAPNIMDQRPFFVFRLDQLDLRLDVLSRFSKRAFDAQGIRDYATDLFFTASITAFLRSELDLRSRPPSEDFVRWVLGHKELYDSSRVTASVVERFEPIVGAALATVLREIVRRSVAALDQGVTEPAQQSEPPVPASPPPAAADAPTGETSTAPVRKGVVTTEGELAAFAVIKEVLEHEGVVAGEIYDPSARRHVPIDLAWTDTTAYFCCYLNKPSWWFARLFIDARQPWVGLPLDPATLRALVPAGKDVIEGHAFATAGVRLTAEVTIKSLAPLFIEAARSIIRGREPQ